ncbi:MAG: hypothetical protein KAG96_04190 [Ichthyobacteriaceae bacterium]|nr:hypothetical protein [Ichthyobacteriaceae bacterium]
MVIDKYIDDLLYRYDCVVIPKFGGFVASKTSARTLHLEHKFLPPTKEIVFNKLLVKNDGLLANYISGSLKISYAEALKIIDNCVAEWKEQLNHNGNATISNVGDFSLDDNGIMAFESNTEANHLTDSFGMVPFTALEVKRESIIVKEIKNAHNDKSIFNYRKVLRYAAILVPVIGIITSVTINNIVGNKSSAYDASLSISGSNNLNTKEVVKKVEEKVVEEKTISIKHVAEVVEPKIIPVVKPDFHYHVIAGLFSQENNAKRCIKNNSNEGLESSVIGKTSKGLYIVSYKSFGNVMDAKQFLNKVNYRYGKKSWILEK